MGNRAADWCYRAIRRSVSALYRRYRIQGLEHLPREGCVLVGNHCQAHGPLVGELRLPFPRKTWCASEMMEKEQVADYAFRDFWSQNPRWTHPFYRLLSHLIVPLAVLLFNHAETIPVYRDSRLLSTFRETLRCLEEGRSVLIFPEQDKRCNHILDDFQEHFIDVAKLWHRRSGKALAFVPMYICPALRVICFSEPVIFDPDAPIDAERERIKKELVRRITALAEELPRHRVVPYRPQPKKYWHFNRPKEATEA
ncbi:MAG: hypothetical protein IKQ04_02250 [Oscillospiraceae bacterium]|nr:hypothetical protein [Oscillospiraceae bacterium]